MLKDSEVKTTHDDKIPHFRCKGDNEFIEGHLSFWYLHDQRIPEVLQIRRIPEKYKLLTVKFCGWLSQMRADLKTFTGR